MSLNTMIPMAPGFSVFILIHLMQLLVEKAVLNQQHYIWMEDSPILCNSIHVWDSPSLSLPPPRKNFSLP